MKKLKFRQLFPLLLFALFSTSCELIDYHPYDVHISGTTDVNATNIARIENACKGKRQIRVAVIGDSHRWYDELRIFVKNINNRNDIDFVIHDGDISEYGYTKEFLWTRDILDKLNVPYVALIGNHDCLGTGCDSYNAVFGPTNFGFVAGNIKFVCVNTNALEYDYSEPIPDFNFLAGQVGNHGHTLRHDDLMGDGVIYHQTASLDDRIFLLFTFNDNGTYDYEEVTF